jgi:hypothetical protein
MAISSEDLKKIKLLNKIKNLKKMIKPSDDEYKDLKDDSDDSDDSDDENFISNRASDGKKSNIKPINVSIRSLDNEVGGKEVDYKKSQKQTDQDVDVWDNRDAEITALEDAAAEVTIGANKSFIHKIKTKSRRNKKSLGQMDLGAAASNIEGAKPKSFVQELRQLRTDKSRGQDGGISF